MEIAPDAPRTPEEEKAAALERCCVALGVAPEYFDGEDVVELGSGEQAWLPRAISGRASRVVAVERDWEETGSPIFSDAAREELGGRVLVTDFLLDVDQPAELGFMPTRIVSVGNLFGPIFSAPDEAALAQVRASIGGWARKLVAGGEMRFGPVPVAEGGGNASAENMRRLRLTVEDLNSDEGFAAQIEPVSEGAEEGYVVVRRAR